MEPRKLDMFGQTIQEYEKLKERAEEIFDIFAKYNKINMNRTTVEKIEIDERGFDVTTESSYCCGEYEKDYYDFPSILLLQSDEDVDAYFKQKREEKDEQERQEKMRKDAEEKRRKEAAEIKLLGELIVKYPLYAKTIVESQK